MNNGMRIRPAERSSEDPCPMVVAVEMGYGHLRAAHTLAELFGTKVIRMDRLPVAGKGEARLWAGLLRSYNMLSQACEWPVAGSAAQWALERITHIAPLETPTNGAPTTILTRLSDLMTQTVIGRNLRALAACSNQPILATYPAAALAARHSHPASVFCLATDTDLNRAWAPVDARQSPIEYLAPVKRVVDRLRSFGVPERRIHLTGFPLPSKLLANAEAALVRRIHRLDPASVFRNQARDEIAPLISRHSLFCPPGPISMTVAIGGAGAQTQQVGRILRSLRPRITAGELHLTLVAGTRRDVAETLGRIVASLGLSVPAQGRIPILFAAEPADYFRRFEECLATTDLLWTKPSELVFYAALGLPLLLAPPVGDQERANRDWLLANRAALDSGNPEELGLRFGNLLASGELCRVAWSGYTRLDRSGSARIQDILGMPERSAKQQ